MIFVEVRSMDCKKYQRDISMLVDGELTPDASVALKEHLAACPACRSTLRAMTALNSQVTSAAPHVDAALASRVKARIADESSQTSHRPLMPIWGRVPLMALIVLLAVGLGNFAGQSIGDIIAGEPRDALVELIAADSTRSFADVMVDLTVEEPTR
jgi:anti-sigma factor RsiW